MAGTPGDGCREEQGEEQQKDEHSRANQTTTPEYLLERNPGYIDNIALKSAEWVDNQLIKSSEGEKEEETEFLRKATLGEFDETLPLYKNSTTMLNKNEKEKEMKSQPLSSLSEEDRKRIETMRSHFPI